jgi:hypothetical protein
MEENLSMGKEPVNPHIPEHVIIITGETITGETKKFARGYCAGSDDSPHDAGKEFELWPGERWTCPDCGRSFVLDGHGVDVTEQEGAAMP